MEYTLTPEIFFPLSGYKYLHAIVLGMLHANGGRSPKAH